MALGNNGGAFASLSSGLLARKGAAKPAMRPQGFGQMGASLEDLGWNDMGFEAPKPTVSLQERDADHDGFGDAVAEQPLRNPVAALTPSPVHGQQAELAARLAEADDAGEPEEADEEDAPETIGASPMSPAPLLHAALPQRVADDVDEEGEAETGFAGRAPVLSLKPRLPDEPAPIATLALGSPVQRAPNGSGPKAAFTLRLDAARHLRLRLACALTGRSAQLLVVAAVDRLLAEYPELDTFAGSLPPRGKSRPFRG